MGGSPIIERPHGPVFSDGFVLVILYDPRPDDEDVAWLDQLLVYWYRLGLVQAYGNPRFRGIVVLEQVDEVLRNGVIQDIDCPGASDDSLGVAFAVLESLVAHWAREAEVTIQRLLIDSTPRWWTSIASSEPRGEWSPGNRISL
jgi:hypothetical protein